MDTATWFLRSDEERVRHERIETLSRRFAERAFEHDQNQSFPHENIGDLRAVGYVNWTTSKRYGGLEIGLHEMLVHQEQLARGDGSTALAIGWHMGLMLNLEASGALTDSLHASIARSVVEQGALINSCASEPATGSPSRGGRPQTLARQVTGGYRLTGRKTFSTLSPELAFVLVTAGIDGSDEVGEFLIHRDDFSIVETWDVMGMRATGSHDIVIQDVFVPQEHLVERRLPGTSSRRNLDGGGWLLHVPACYLGIALNARDIAVQHATTYQPNSLSQPISEVDHIQAKMGAVELKLLSARTMMYDLAMRWDRATKDERLSLRPYLSGVKTFATNTALEVVDLSMRVVGAKSISRQMPLERLYRDVRAGLHNPPMDDVTYKLLANAATEEFREKMV